MCAIHKLQPFCRFMDKDFLALFNTTVSAISLRGIGPNLKNAPKVWNLKTSLGTRPNKTNKLTVYILFFHQIPFTQIKINGCWTVSVSLQVSRGNGRGVGEREVGSWDRLRVPSKHRHKNLRPEMRESSSEQRARKRRVSPSVELGLE